MGLHPVKVAQLDKLRQSYAGAPTTTAKLVVISETISVLGLDYEPLARENASSGFPCALLRQCSVVLASIY
jgi:hypothetical protein